MRFLISWFIFSTNPWLVVLYGEAVINLTLFFVAQSFKVILVSSNTLSVILNSPSVCIIRGYVLSASSMISSNAGIISFRSRVFVERMRKIVALPLMPHPLELFVQRRGRWQRMRSMQLRS